MSTRVVRLQNSTIEKLSRKGKFGQSFNDVIEALIQDKESSA